MLHLSIPLAGSSLSHARCSAPPATARAPSPASATSATRATAAACRCTSVPSALAWCSRSRRAAASAAARGHLSLIVSTCAAVVAMALHGCGKGRIASHRGVHIHPLDLFCLLCLCASSGASAHCAAFCLLQTLPLGNPSSHPVCSITNSSSESSNLCNLCDASNPPMHTPCHIILTITAPSPKIAALQATAAATATAAP